MSTTPSEASPQEGIFRPESFEPVTEPWAEYRMGDFRVRVRFTPSTMGRIYDQDGLTLRMNPAGEPLIQMTGQLTIAVWPFHAGDKHGSSV